MTLSILSTLRSWIFGPSSDETPSLLLDRHGTLINKDLAGAFCALLIALSLTDETLHESEVSEIIAILRHELALSPGAAEDTLSVALEARQAPDEVYPKLRTLAAGMGDDQKEYLLTLTLKVAAADERVSSAEAMIVRRLAEVLHLSDEQVENVRKRA